LPICRNREKCAERSRIFIVKGSSRCNFSRWRDHASCVAHGENTPGGHFRIMSRSKTKHCEHGRQ
jgi:hypothetical protein